MLLKLTQYDLDFSAKNINRNVPIYFRLSHHILHDLRTADNWLTTRSAAVSRGLEITSARRVVGPNES